MSLALTILSILVVVGVIVYSAWCVYFQLNTKHADALISFKNDWPKKLNYWYGLFVQVVIVSIVILAPVIALGIKLSKYLE